MLEVSGPAEQFMKRLKSRLTMIEIKKKADEIVQVDYAGAFGVMHVAQISAEGPNTLGVVVKDRDGVYHTILAPASQCSVMLSLVTPTKDSPVEKVIIGFSEDKASGEVTQEAKATGKATK